MAVTRSKAKNRREGGAFVPLPVSVLNHPNFYNLSLTANKLLMDMLSQLRFAKDGPKNNGDLCPTWSLMKARGWRSESTLSQAKKELLHYGFIILTRQGEILRSDKPNLNAITWWAINECDGKLEINATQAPPGNWKREYSKFVKATKSRKLNKITTTPIEVIHYGKRSDSLENDQNIVSIGASSLRESK